MDFDGDRLPAAVRYAGMVGSGLCQFNVLIPGGASGDMEMIITVDGVSTPAGLILALE